ncbi:hypothetical protein Tco_0310118 [Tanacetum coccineum]
MMETTNKMIKLLQENEGGIVVVGNFDGFGGLDNSKKALALKKLAELALANLKRVKWILSNRKPAARFKEMKICLTFKNKKLKLWFRDALNETNIADMELIELGKFL